MAKRSAESIFTLAHNGEIAKALHLLADEIVNETVSAEEYNVTVNREAFVLRITCNMNPKERA